MRVRIGTIVALLLGIVGAAFLLPASAAAEAPDATRVATEQARSSYQELTISGTLVDETDPANPQPVEGVRITVKDQEGTEIGEATSDSDGKFSIPVPGNGTYIVAVDTDTLPPDTFLRNPDDVERQISVIGFSPTVQFPIGPDTRNVSGGGEEILERLVSGVFFGIVLALSALGLSMIFGTTGLTNFAHGEVIAFGAVVAYGFNVTGMHIIPAGIIAVVATGLFGYLQDVALWRPLRHKGIGLIAMMIVSIGMAIFLRNLYQYLIGGSRKVYSEYLTEQPIFSALSLTWRDVVIMVIAVAVIVGVTAALSYTRMGKAMRAVADNPPLAASSGIDVDRVIAVVWIGGAALAGLGGVLYALKFQFDYQLGLRLLLLVFAAVILGGIGTIWGSIFGAMIVAVFIEMSTLVIPAELKYTGALAVMIVILLFRPTGLLNRAQRIG